MNQSRLDHLNESLDRRDRQAPQTRRIVGEVFDGGSMPTEVPRVYLVHPVDFNGDETEGATPADYVDASTTIPVVVLGPEVPSVGDRLIAVATAGRWVAEKGKGCRAAIRGSVYGCGGRLVVGCAVEVRLGSAGGTLLGSTTTNELGQYDLDVTGAEAGQDLVLVFSKARFAESYHTLEHTTGAADSTHWKCGGTSDPVSAFLTPAEGYHCFAFCADPLPETLHYTRHDTGDSGTATWTSGAWLDDAPGIPVKLLLYPDGTAIAGITLGEAVSADCPPAFSASLRFPDGLGNDFYVTVTE